MPYIYFRLDYTNEDGTYKKTLRQYFRLVYPSDGSVIFNLFGTELENVKRILKEKGLY